jgi:divalent metal cation (Fe/Co/Zn/Cd) transporter
MTQLPQISPSASNSFRQACAHWKRSETVFWLQGITLAWMLVECVVSLYAAVKARSPVMLAFGSDSFVELLSALVVLLQFTPRFTLRERTAQRSAGVLLFGLALVVTTVAIFGLVFHVRAQTSALGIGITFAALIIMPALAWLKRREARRRNNAALGADAVQSATCAYLAAISLLGLGVNALFHIAWFDSLAALVAVPLLIKEGSNGWHGKHCACC